MTFIDLCAGIGGLSLGLQRAGMTCAGHVEIEPFCQRVLEKHWPGVPLLADVREVTGFEFGEVGLIAAGYPCQPFSEAGQRKGAADPRHLWPEIARLVRTIRPGYVLLENVTGHLSLGFGDVLGDLAACGYDAEWDCIPAAALGAPHRRDRVFIVAYPISERRDGRKRTYETGRRLQAKLGKTREENRRAFWDVEPAVDRMATRLPARVDRVRALGNAVVPQVAEYIGRQIMEADKRANT